MPSLRYEELTWGASGTQYTSPDNGWLWCNIYPKTRITITTYDEDGTDHYNITQNATGWARIILPVAKGRIFKVWWDSSDDTKNLRFYYNVGSQNNE